MYVCFAVWGSPSRPARPVESGRTLGENIRKFILLDLIHTLEDLKWDDKSPTK